MKKLAIAGASVALAAMPILSTFALPTVTDHLTVTVGEQCVFGTTTPAKDQDGNVENNYFAEVAPGETGTFTAGTDASHLGSNTSIQLNCNAPEGFVLTPDFSSLVWDGGDSTQDITYGGAATPAAGTWTAYYNGTNFADETPLDGDPTMTQTYTFTYKVTAGADQAAGDYEGTAEYVLTAGQ